MAAPREGADAIFRSGSGERACGLGFAWCGRTAVGRRSESRQQRAGPRRSHQLVPGSRGLPTLAVSDTLSAAAKWMSFDMGAHNYFAHTSLDGRSPTQRMYDAGYPAFGTWTGEDLAAGYTTTADVLNGWINSPAHYAVLVNPQYHAIG